MSLNPLKPYLYGAVALVAVSGWAFGGYQTLRYVSEQRDHSATKAQVATDANTASEAALQALQAAHDEEIRTLTEELQRNQQAAAQARAEKSRLLAQLGRFERELESLRDEPKTAAYLAMPVPGAIRDRLRDAQHRHEAESR